MVKSIKRFVIEKICDTRSPIVTIFVGWLLTLIATPYSDMLPPAVQFCLTHKNILFALFLGWLVLDFIYDHFHSIIAFKDSELQKLISQNELYERNANLSANIILNKYGEFANFQRMGIFSDIFRRFVSGNVDIECAQIYRFETFYQESNVVIKINYIAGYVQEGTEINGIIQEYYYVDMEIAKELDEIVELWRKILTQGKTMSYNDLQNKKNDFSVKIISLFDKLVDELNNVADIKDVSEKDFSNYLIVIILLRFMNDTETITLNTEILKNRTVDEFLSGSKRNGILGSILLRDSFSFLHNGRSLKSGRIYFFEYLNIYQEEYIVTFCINSNRNILDESAIIYDLDRYSTILQEMLISNTK